MQNYAVPFLGSLNWGVSVVLKSLGKRKSSKSETSESTRFHIKHDVITIDHVTEQQLWLKLQVYTSSSRQTVLSCIFSSPGKIIRVCCDHRNVNQAIDCWRAQVAVTVSMDVWNRGKIKRSDGNGSELTLSTWGILCPGVLTNTSHSNILLHKIHRCSSKGMWRKVKDSQIAHYHIDMKRKKHQVKKCHIPGEPGAVSWGRTN